MPGSVFADNALVNSFANCAGRYSAEMEHAWLMSDPKAEDFEHRRKGFVSLLEATTTSENAEQVLSHRINSKHAHAALLYSASFDPDAARSEAARGAATRLLEQCNFLLLGGA